MTAPTIFQTHQFINHFSFETKRGFTCSFLSESFEVFMMAYTEVAPRWITSLDWSWKLKKRKSTTSKFFKKKYSKDTNKVNHHHKTFLDLLISQLQFRQEVIIFPSEKEHLCETAHMINFPSSNLSLFSLFVFQKLDSLPQNFRIPEKQRYSFLFTVFFSNFKPSLNCLTSSC